MDLDLREQARKWVAVKARTACRWLCFVAILLNVIIVISRNPAVAQVNCEALPAGPSRTDCYIGRARVGQGTSAISTEAAKQSRDAARFECINGRRPNRQGPSVRVSHSGKVIATKRPISSMLAHRNPSASG